MAYIFPPCIQTNILGTSYVCRKSVALLSFFDYNLQESGNSVLHAFNIIHIKLKAVFILRCVRCLSSGCTAATGLFCQGGKIDSRLKSCQSHVIKIVWPRQCWCVQKKNPYLGLWFVMLCFKFHVLSSLPWSLTLLIIFIFCISCCLPFFPLCPLNVEHCTSLYLVAIEIHVM